MKKIALFVGSMSKGGTERVVLNLAKYFTSIGVKVLLVTAWQNQNEYEIPKEIERFNVALTKEEWTKNKIKNVLLRNKKRRQIIEEFQPDLIVSFIKENNFKAIMTGRKVHVPVVVSVRSDPAAEYPKFMDRLLVKLLFPKADGMILQTQSMKGFFSKKLQKKAVILPNSVNPLFIRDSFPEHRRKEIVLVGRLDANKNQKLAIEAFAPLAKEYPDWNMVLYGEGSSRKMLEQTVSDLGLNERVKLPGSVQDIQDRIADSAVFLLTSGFEGMPNALIEAMASGLACISTDCAGGGPKEIIEDGKNGFLIPVGDKEALKEKLECLMKDETLRNRMGEEAAKIGKKLHPDAVNEAWREYLEGILAGRR